MAGLALAKEQVALMVAEDMALALANLKLRETLLSQAIRDPLTGLFNRRYMEETMARELIRVKRLGVPLGVIMMDLDHFKEYNDTFGHTAGDELLSALGHLVKSQIRGEDIACRYGGEEFLVIMPGITVEIALERAETLRRAVKEMHLLQPGLKPTTLSLGVAVLSEPRRYRSRHYQGCRCRPLPRQKVGPEYGGAGRDCRSNRLARFGACSPGGRITPAINVPFLPCPR